MPLDLTKPVQTRDGRKARIICTDGKHELPSYRVWALVMSEYGNETAFPYDVNGMFEPSTGPHLSDLVNIPERRTIFKAIWVSGDTSVITKLSLSEIKKAYRNDKSFIELTIEDGVVVDSKIHQR